MINKFGKLKTKSGFTLVEILIVVAIIALLATLAIPSYTRHTQRARAMEAVATMTMIRQSLRDYFINNSTYLDIASPDVSVAPPTGAGVDVEIVQYFSNAAFSVVATSPAFTDTSIAPAAVNFVITADGSISVPCGASSCALNQAGINDYRLEMDNTGRTFVSYDSGGVAGTWSSY